MVGSALELMFGHEPACARHGGNVALLLLQPERLLECSSSRFRLTAGPQHLGQGELHVAMQVEEVGRSYQRDSVACEPFSLEHVTA
jgi:hypothetical protein